MTPMMTQYLATKEQYGDAILFYRLGDFYEMFFEDAKTVSRELDLVLTGKDCGEPERAPMCGIPYHAADSYIARLVAKGYKVVVCEQMEDPATAKGLVKRDVIRVVTPGTVIDNNYLDDRKNNYLASAYIAFEDEKSGKICGGIAFADASTGDVTATTFFGSEALKTLLTSLGTYSPREVITNLQCGILSAFDSFITERLNALCTRNREQTFDYDRAIRTISSNIHSIPECNLEYKDYALRAIGALIEYIAENQRQEKANVKKITFYSDSQFLEMDLNTRRNLELCEAMRTKEKKGTLLWVLDKTRTSMGARLLRKWVEMPLCDVKAIQRRQKAVSELFDTFMLREELSDLLKDVLDLERLLTKILYTTANARDLKGIAQTLRVLPEIKKLISDCKSEQLQAIYIGIDTMSDLSSLLESSIADDPPYVTKEGGIIRDGYNETLDRLRDIVKNGKSFISKIEESEREKTGIRNLKIGYNRVFGYYIEVSKVNLSLVPETYIRKQTLANGERYITQELKELEAEILGAGDKINALEYELFVGIRDKVSECAARLQSTSDSIAQLDVYLSLADVAVKNNYVCPDIEYDETLKIKDGRHPVVEKYMSDGYFVPNDTNLDTNHNRLMLITGPNMAGKSTYMRQVALICVMAQIGSFVPAKEASIGIVDKLFTRVGASDDLASGQSTFMLEMTEVAYILNNATSKSLIIYDEIGRGTSTFDGMSIAQAVAEYTLSKKIHAKTLFATHYHELTSMEGDYDGVVNYNIAAKKKGDEIVFLRKIVKGATDDSYGIEVAKLAGVPGEVTKRAKSLLSELENKSRVMMQQSRQQTEEVEANITFDDLKEEQVIDKLKNTDPEILTPREALDFVYELKKLLDK